MKISHLFLFVLLVIAVSGTSHAMQDKEEGSEGTGSEPECEYIFMINYI